MTSQARPRHSSTGRLLVSLERVVLGAILAVASGAPAFALCPNCLAQKNAWDAQSGVLAVFLVMPFVAAYVVWRVLRRLLASPSQGPELAKAARSASAPAVSRSVATDRT